MFQLHSLKSCGRGRDGWEFIFVSEINVQHTCVSLYRNQTAIKNFIRSNDFIQKYTQFMTRNSYLMFIVKVSLGGAEMSHTMKVFFFSLNKFCSRQRKRTIVRRISSGTYHIDRSESGWTERIRIA